MIKEGLSAAGSEVITSDQWHVVHSRFVAHPRRPAFVRGVFSEHADRRECMLAARALRRRLASSERQVPEAERDEVFVLPPNYKSLKRSKRRKKVPAEGSHGV